MKKNHGTSLLLTTFIRLKFDNVLKKKKIIEECVDNALGLVLTFKNLHLNIKQSITNVSMLRG